MGRLSQHEVRVPVRWSDADVLGHVNAAVYLTFIEELVDEWLTPLLGQDQVTARVELDYLHELPHGTKSVMVAGRVEKVGRSSITFGATVSPEGGEAAVAARVVAVVWDPETRRSRPLTAEERAELQPEEVPTAADESVDGRVARFDELGQWTVQVNERVPEAVRDMLYARKLVTAAAPAGVQGPFRNPAAVTVDDFSLTYAVCPPGQGPGLHKHLRTTETFICLRGRFRVYWGEAGEHETVLDEFDLISIPPGVIRGFQNVGDDDGTLQVLITGGVNDMDDIWMPLSVVEAIKAHGDDVFAEIEKTGVHFE